MEFIIVEAIEVIGGILFLIGFCGFGIFPILFGERTKRIEDRYSAALIGLAVAGGLMAIGAVLLAIGSICR